MPVKRLTALLLCLMYLLPVPACADGDFSVSARAACLIDAASGRVLYAQNADVRYPMASTTKIMTALLALENAALDDPITAGEDASGVEGTSIYLAAGETLSLRDMLYGLMLRSGNDAAVAIAEHIAGSVPDFAAMMNARAAQLGADAVFVNPHGLPADGHAATARAMALIAREAMTNPDFRTVVSTRRATIPWIGNDFARVLTNKNRLLTTYPGATGIKTGYTKAAGRCLVFSAEQEGMELIGCVLNCPDWFSEAARLLDYGFAQYDAVTLLRAGEIAAHTNVLRAKNPRLPLTVGADLSLPLAEGEQYHLEFHTLPATAPVAAGQQLGHVSVFINNAHFTDIPLTAACDIPEWGLLPALRKILGGWAAEPPDHTGGCASCARLSPPYHTVSFGRKGPRKLRQCVQKPYPLKHENLARKGARFSSFSIHQLYSVLSSGYPSAQAFSLRRRCRRSRRMRCTTHSAARTAPGSL